MTCRRVEFLPNLKSSLALLHSRSESGNSAGNQPGRKWLGSNLPQPTALASSAGWIHRGGECLRKLLEPRARRLELPDRPRPALGILAHERRELGGRARLRLRAEIEEPAGKRRIRHHLSHFSADLVHAGGVAAGASWRTTLRTRSPGLSRRSWESPAPRPNASRSRRPAP